MKNNYKPVSLMGLKPFNTYAKKARYGFYVLNYDTDKVLYFFSDITHHIYFPYKWDKKLNCYNNCKNTYSVKYIQKLERENQVIFN